MSGQEEENNPIEIEISPEMAATIREQSTDPDDAPVLAAMFPGLTVEQVLKIMAETPAEPNSSTPAMPIAAKDIDSDRVITAQDIFGQNSPEFVPEGQIIDPEALQILAIHNRFKTPPNDIAEHLGLSLEGVMGVLDSARRIRTIDNHDLVDIEKLIIDELTKHDETQEGAGHSQRARENPVPQTSFQSRFLRLMRSWGRSALEVACETVYAYQKSVIREAQLARTLHTVHQLIQRYDLGANDMFDLLAQIKSGSATFLQEGYDEGLFYMATAKDGRPVFMLIEAGTGLPITAYPRDAFSLTDEGWVRSSKSDLSPFLDHHKEQLQRPGIVPIETDRPRNHPGPDNTSTSPNVG